MKLTRIRIEQFRQFRQPLQITDLEPGINVYVGPNEAGKSSIVAALRAAFFERHRSSSVEDLRPWGDSAATPSVEVDFRFAGQDYRLTKSFLGRKRCELRIGTSQLDGAAAEDRLAELLGFQYAGRGASGAEHWGIPGLLWVSQGTTQELKPAVDHATDHLRTALNSAFGEVTSSQGDQVLTQVEEARNELLTPATGMPRGILQEALKRVAGLQAQLTTLDAEIAAYQHQVDALAQLRSDHAADAQEQPWLACRQSQAMAQEQLSAIAQVESLLGRDLQRQGEIEATVNWQRAELERLERQETMAVTQRSALQDASAASQRAGCQASEWQTRMTQAQAQMDRAVSTLRQVRQRHARTQLLQQINDLRARTEARSTTLTQAQDHEARQRKLQQQLAGLSLPQEDLHLLRKLELDRRELRIQQHAAATRLRFELLPDQQISLDGQALTDGGERLLLRPARIDVAGFGRLEILPGGADLAELGQREQRLSHQQDVLMRQLGLASLEAAEARSSAQAQTAAELTLTVATLRALAPQGVEELRIVQVAELARLADLVQTLEDQLPPPGESEHACPTVAVAEAAVDTAAAALEQIRGHFSSAQLAASQAQAQCEAAERECLRAEALLAAPERAEQLSHIQHGLLESRAELAQLQSKIGVHRDSIARAQPQILQQDVERYRRSADQLEQRHGERRDRLMRLEVELQSVGAQGADERRAALARDLAQAQRRSRELQRRAATLDYLLRLLREKRNALTTRLQAPLQKRLDHYLQMLFPQAQMQIDPSLSPGPLTRTSTAGPDSGPVDALSFGAREQIGLISRLAYADLLQEAGRPTLIILDDAIVHTDDARLPLLKRALFDAATRHQILLFTCHPSHWRDLGAAMQSLDELRQSSSGR